MCKFATTIILHLRFTKKIRHIEHNTQCSGIGSSELAPCRESSEAEATYHVCIAPPLAQHRVRLLSVPRGAGGNGGKALVKLRFDIRNYNLLIGVSKFPVPVKNASCGDALLRESWIKQLLVTLIVLSQSLTT